MQCAILSSKSKRISINLIILAFYVLLLPEIVLADRHSWQDAKIYNSLKVDPIVNSISSASESDDLNAPLKSSLLNIGGSKLTPSPNEDIDLYTGILRLHYIDFSTPIAPGLNLEVSRVYDSTVYNYVNYPQVGDVWAYDINLPSWNISTSYVLDRNPQTCGLPNDPCDLILIHTNGSAESLRREDNNTQKWTSKNGSIFDGTTGLLIDKRGFKYYYGDHDLPVNGGYRMYLTRVETPDGKHWLNYKYRGHYLQQISSSDPNKTININLEPVYFHKQHQGDFRMDEPSGITFNGKRILTYTYSFFDGGKRHYGRLALTGVTKANGDIISYGYEFINLKKKHADGEPSNWRLLLNNVSYSNGEGAHYTYIDDDDLFDHMYLRNIRLHTITHHTNNKFNNLEVSNGWQINESSTSIYEGIKSRTITIQGPYHATTTIFSHSSNEFSWQAGLPLEHIVYKDNNIATTNIAQKEIYRWDKRLFSNKYYYLSSSIKDAGFDTTTHKPRLKNKQTQIYNSDSIDNYNVQIEGYDEYDNPTDLLITGNAGNTRKIVQNYYNNTEKNILGLKTSIAIDGNIIQQQDYDNDGNVITNLNLGKKFSFSYTDGLLSSKTDANGNTTYYQNYVGTEPGLVINPDGTSVNKEINLDGTTKSETDANGNKTNYEYNLNQELIKVSPAKGSDTNHSYNNFTKTTNIDNYSSVESYNHSGLLIKKTENNSKQQIIHYDGLGRKIFESYPYLIGENKADSGHYYKYDSLNRLLTDCYPSNTENCIIFTYLTNNTIKTTAPTGEYKITTYDPFAPGNNNPIKIVEDARTTILERDYLDRVINVTQTDKTNSITKYYYYDNNHNLAKYTEPETGITEYIYDKSGNLREKLQNGKKTIYKLNEKNYRIKEKSYDDESYSEYFSYDNNGNIIESKKGSITRTYDYDENNQLIKEGLILNNKYENVPNQIYVNYKYNSKGDLSGITYPDNTNLDLNPDDYGNPTNLGEYVNNINYHANGKWQSYQLSNGTSANTEIDNLNRVNTYKYGSVELNYTYDSNNNLINLNLNDSKNKDYHYKLNFNYDLLGRLIYANGPWGNKTYSYDSFDNITSIINKDSSTNQEVKFNYTNLRLNSVSYDAHGNIIKDKYNKYYYGLDSNLLNAYGSKNGYYQYDTNGHRVIKTESSYSGDNNIITFYSKSGEALFEYYPKYNKSIKYIYLNGHKLAKIEEPLITDSKSDTKHKVEYYYNDAIGSPAAMADSQGNILWHQVYEPYGNTYLQKVKSRENKHWFAGKEVDKTELSYFGARYYSTNTARFMSPDPVEVKPEIPTTFNRYVYANNNPYKYVDPDGNFSFSDLPSFPEPFVNAVAGFGDGVSSILTFGFYSTKDVRNSLDIGSVDHGALSYNLGNYSGKAWGAGTYWAAGLNGGSNSVFWSGYSQGAQKTAMGIGTTLEKTPIGKTLDFMHNNTSLKIPNSVWKIASGTFALNARGTASAVIRSNNPNSVWRSVEKPILDSRGVPIRYVGVD